MRKLARSRVLCRTRLVPVSIAALTLLSLLIFGQDAAGERIDERVRILGKKLKREGARWRAGNVSAFYPSEEESRKLFPPIPPIPEDVRETLPVIRAAGIDSFPLAWDWRELNGVTSVKHQFRPHDCDTCYRYCGSCYAFAACAQLESFIKIYDGREEDLSEQQILSCHSEPSPPSGPGGCYGGNATLAYNPFLDPGAVAETCMVYEADHSIPCREHECSIHGRISGYSIVANDTRSLKLALLSGPVWINMYSCDDFKYFYSGGSYTYPPGVASVPNHAMLCVGWNDTLTVCDSTGCDTIGSWIIKNSWGAAWGYDGYGYIQYGTPTFADEATQIHYARGPVMRLHLREPDGGQVWAAGSLHKILWRGAGVAADRFELGYFSGGQYRLIDGNVDPQASEYLWAPGEEAIGECRIGIAARGPDGGLAGSDMSDDPFAVIEPRTDWEVSGVGVCGGSAPQESPEVACDNLGGAIVVWRDARNGNSDIFAQRLDGSGNMLWPAPGACVSASSTYRSGVRAVSDGSGGAFVVWEDTPPDGGGEMTGTDINAQHVRSNGTPVARTIAVCAAPEAQRRPQLVPDSSGGAYVVWDDMRNGNGDIYIKRIESSGGNAWEAEVPVCAAADAQTRPQIAEDGSGGAIVAWTDRRAGSEYIYAQRILATGEPAWQQNGVAVCRAPGILASCKIISDRRGGAIIAWLEQSSVAGLEIRAQRIRSNGIIPWLRAGVSVCPEALDPHNIAIASDGLGGFIAAWDDARGEWVGQVYHPVSNIQEVESQRDIYAQRIDARGQPAWAAGGVAIASLPRAQEMPCIAHDGAGGAIIAWSDKRDSRWVDAGDLNIPEDENNRDIFAQRIDTAGNVLWRANGEPLCAEVSGQFNATLTPEHGPAAFVAWEDSRESSPKVFIQKIAGDYSAHRCVLAAALMRNGASVGVSGAILSSCPGGDHRDTLRIVCDFVDMDMAGIPYISPSEIELAADGSGVSFCDSASAGTPGTPENGYAVTLIRHRVKGCSACPGGSCALGSDSPQRLTLRYSGAVIGSLEGPRIRSIDAAGSGVVNALTNDGMGPGFGWRSNDARYRRCYDYDGSGRIDENDLSAIAAHYGHGCSASASVPALPARSAGPDVGLKFIIKRTDAAENAGKLAVAIVIENAHDLSSLCFAVNNASPLLSFRRWIPEPSQTVRFPVARAVRDGRAILFIAGYGLRALDGPSIEIGTLEYDVTGTDTSSAAERSWENTLFLVFGDFVDVNGAIRSIAGASYEEEAPGFSASLSCCYPNPFNPKTTIKYSIKARGAVALRIYTVAGQLVKTLVSAVQDPRVTGYTVEWDGRNNEGSLVSSGVYLYRLTAGDFSETKKMVLLR